MWCNYRYNIYQQVLIVCVCCKIIAQNSKSRRESKYAKVYSLEYFKGKNLMIVGGTGAFGTTVLKQFLTSEIGEIRIYSKDEKTRRFAT